MKKKLLLIPTTLLLVSGLMGCQFRKQRTVQPYYLDYWLNEASDRKEDDPNRPHGSIHNKDEQIEQGFSDSSLKFRDKLKEILRPIELTPGEVDKEVKDDNYYVLYQIHAYLADFDSCLIYINEDGTISTNAYAGGWGAPKAQHYVYDIGKDATKEIIDYAVASYITKE